jgi:VIT1/CCC1 family predicted Fe2+/Mn2+ transporter
VTAGLAEIAAGAIAMGLGGYLAAKSDVEHYASERAREEFEIKEKLDIEKKEVDEILQSYGLAPDESRTVVEALAKRPDAFVDFMMRFELGLERPDPKRARLSAATIGGAYVVGGLIPLSPYFFVADSRDALWPSVTLTLGALFVFGWLKGRFVGAPLLRSALQTVMIGGLAAATAYLVAQAISH